MRLRGEISGENRAGQLLSGRPRIRLAHLCLALYLLNLQELFGALFSELSLRKRSGFHSGGNKGRSEKRGENKIGQSGFPSTSLPPELHIRGYCSMQNHNNNNNHND